MVVASGQSCKGRKMVCTKIVQGVRRSVVNVPLPKSKTPAQNCRLDRSGETPTMYPCDADSGHSTQKPSSPPISVHQRQSAANAFLPVSVPPWVDVPLESAAEIEDFAPNTVPVDDRSHHPLS